MNPTGYNSNYQSEYEEILDLFGGSVRFDRYLRVCETPHSLPVKVWEITKDKKLEEYKEAAPAIMQRLRWIKYLKLEKMKELLSGIAALKSLPTDERISAINELKLAPHEISPFKDEPVDCVIWVKNETIHANDYNPNSVAPPEMELLRLSISNDGYTQPIVSMQNEDGTREVIDGFHRNRVGKECDDVKQRVHGYLPVVTIRETQKDKANRIAATIRHNRARGKHRVESMSEIVVDLKKRNWSPAKIGKELGMDQDEVLRLTQISGLTEMFANKDFSMAWEPIESV